MRFLGWDRGVAVDQASEHTAQRFDTQGQRCDVEQNNIFHVPLQNTSLNGRAHGNNFIRIHAFVWLFAEEFGHFLNHFWHAGHPTNQNDFVDIARRQAGVFQRSLAGLQRRFDEIPYQAFQFGACKFHDQVQRLTRCPIH